MDFCLFVCLFNLVCFFVFFAGGGVGAFFLNWFQVLLFLQLALTNWALPTDLLFCILIQCEPDKKVFFRNQASFTHVHTQWETPHHTNNNCTWGTKCQQNRCFSFTRNPSTCCHPISHAVLTWEELSHDLPSLVKDFPWHPALWINPKLELSLSGPFSGHAWYWQLSFSDDLF